MPENQFRPPPTNVIKTLYAVGLGPLVGRLILLLTTTGRKSGLPRTVPLQYEIVDGDYYLGSARGVHSDWFRNIQADPRVEVRVKSRHFHGTAQTITDPDRIADFLELRLRRHPLMVGKILESDGLPAKPEREQLECYAAKLAMVIIHPDQAG